ncbi:hypothetical protein K710_0743 [Streptococcus iniae SF1]|nr:hypothetical protein K710_0743 [Streptococcus iniae SF1]
MQPFAENVNTFFKNFCLKHDFLVLKKIMIEIERTLLFD